jgi:Tol biopolymer transport system component
MLTTKEVSSILEVSGTKLNPNQVAELARNQAFPKAYKDDKNANWLIPVEDVIAFIHLQKHKRQRRWITVGAITGAITFIITILGLLSITKDTVDLLTTYVFPHPIVTATVTPTPTPAPIGKISASSPAYCCIVTLNMDDSNRASKLWASRGPGYRIFESDSSLDGTYFAYTMMDDHAAYTTSDDKHNADIYKINAYSGEQTPLTKNTSDDRHPTWSPDGKSIAFTTNRDGNWEIYVMKADGSEQTRLTDNPAADSKPDWSFDGRYILFISNRDGNLEIYVMKADGSEQTRLTDNPAQDSDPAWSPDGKYIAFTTNRDGNWEIYIMKADGSEQTRLTHHPADDTEPVFSPDGNYIAFTSNRNSNSDIFIMRVNGGKEQYLSEFYDVDNNYSNSSPSWVLN